MAEDGRYLVSFPHLQIMHSLFIRLEMRMITSSFSIHAKARGKIKIFVEYTENRIWNTVRRSHFPVFSPETLLHYSNTFVYMYAFSMEETVVLQCI